MYVRCHKRWTTASRPRVLIDNYSHRPRRILSRVLMVVILIFLARCSRQCYLHGQMKAMPGAMSLFRSAFPLGGVDSLGFDRIPGGGCIVHGGCISFCLPLVASFRRPILRNLKSLSMCRRAGEVMSGTRQGRSRLEDSLHMSSRSVYRRYSISTHRNGILLGKKLSPLPAPL